MTDDTNNNVPETNEDRGEETPIEGNEPMDSKSVDEPKDDVIFEEEDGEGNTLSPVAKISKLREKLKKSEAERMEYLSGWQRAKADLVNARQRDEQDKKEFAKYANEELIEELLTVLDSFDMAFSNKEAWEKVDKNWRVGVEYIYSQFLTTLQRFNLKVIDPVGQKFDPNHHVSINTVDVSDKAQDGVILGVMQKGYELNGKVVRAPKVTVGEFKG